MTFKRLISIVALGVAFLSPAPASAQMT